MRSLFFLLLLFFSFHSTTTSINRNRNRNRNLIKQTCKNCSQNDPNISYKFCITSLQAAPNISRADNLRELGMISIKLIRHNVTDTRLHIKELLKNKKLDPYIRACLNDCFELYSDSIPALRQAIKDYKAKHYEDANIEVSSVLDASTTCEDGFKEKKGVVSPLKKRNNASFQLSAISLSIINMLLG
ncbi:Pectinesterase inhibitor [Quillaja saponaria]|uniref:Pectinesterase inhibitor n=1 Tax=Quillaja saponaria TaxID=32244 RepID=A0AAD7LPB1_QUISA|nr:Pectinesterase inhibitor [Quillaja saponaria]